MTTIPPIPSFYPVQALYPDPFANREIPLQVIASIENEIEELSAIASQLNQPELIDAIAECSFLQYCLKHMASPQFWRDNLGIQVPGEYIEDDSVPFLQLSKMETCEAALLELKRLDEMRILIRVKTFFSPPMQVGGAFKNTLVCKS